MEINLGSNAFGLDFHPNDQMVAAALVSGDLQLYRYGANDETPQRLFEVNAHRDYSCRAVRFINGGQAMLTASSGGLILAVDLETGSEIVRVENTHKKAIYSLVNITESTFATGDDKGFIKVWDTRQRSCCNSFEPHEDYVSDMTVASDSSKLLATSGDGTLSVCNLRSNEVETQSESSEEELSSVIIMKNGRKVIWASLNGTLFLYSWGFFEDCSDRFVDLSPNSVNALLKLDEERVITASGNGLIRKFLGSISHDEKLKLWDLDELLLEPENTQNGQNFGIENDSDEMDVDANPPKSKKGSKKKNWSSNSTASNFFAHL